MRPLMTDVIAVGMAMLIGMGVVAQMPEGHGPHQAGEQQQEHRLMPMDPEAMMQRCQQMHQHMQEMHERIQQMDQTLEAQIQAMDEAEGGARIDAMAEAIRTLAGQRRQMHQQREQMMQSMMRHMGEHMMMEGEENQRQQMMRRCPMMQGRGMMQRPQEDDDEAGHEAHQ